MRMERTTIVSWRTELVSIVTTLAYCFDNIVKPLSQLTCSEAVASSLTAHSQQDHSS